MGGGLGEFLLGTSLPYAEPFSSLFARICFPTHPPPPPIVFLMVLSTKKKKEEVNNTVSMEYETRPLHQTLNPLLTASFYRICQVPLSETKQVKVTLNQTLLSAPDSEYLGADYMSPGESTYPGWLGLPRSRSVC